MIIDFCGVRLKRIVKEDLELLRTWRNDRKIVQVMFFREYITKEMQLAWFEQLKPTDYYFIISYHDQALGLVNLIDENSESKEAYAGLFIYDESYWGSSIAVLASLALLNFAFEERCLNVVLAKVQPFNDLAKNYNRKLGFTDVQDDLQSISKENFLKKVLPLILRIGR